MIIHDVWQLIVDNIIVNYHCSGVYDIEVNQVNGSIDCGDRRVSGIEVNQVNGSID